MIDKTADTQVPIHELIASRWSGRAYDPDRPVEREKLTAILEAARWAPSCFNDQPWRYLVWDRFRDPDNWQQALACLAEKNQGWAQRAPLLMLATAGTAFSHNNKPNRWGQYDTGAASENICLQAAALGLMAHQMGGFDVDRVRVVFAIPDAYDCMAMITIGYAGDPTLLDEDLRQAELDSRSRQPLEKHFYESSWAQPLTAG